MNNSDNVSESRFGKGHCDRMTQYLKRYFHPTQGQYPKSSLTIRSGKGGARRLKTVRLRSSTSIPGSIVSPSSSSPPPVTLEDNPAVQGLIGSVDGFVKGNLSLPFSRADVTTANTAARPVCHATRRCSRATH
jgi:hypothetical protein